MTIAQPTPASCPVHWPYDHPWVRVAVASRNPLLRRASGRELVVARIAAAILAMLMLSCLITCYAVFGSGRRAEVTQPATRHPVTAMVTGSADPHTIGNRYLVSHRLKVSYRLDGVVRHGEADRTSAAPVGSTVRVWVADSDGRIIAAPQTTWDTVRDTAMVVACCLGLLTGVISLGRRAFESWTLHRHSGAWDEEWRDFNRSPLR